MIKYLYILLGVSLIAFGESSTHKAAKLIGENLLEDMKDILATVGVNCGDPTQYPIFIEEVGHFTQSLVDFGLQIGTQLALKPDYPTACHVLSQSIIDQYNPIETRTRLRGKKKKIDIVIDGYRPKPVYYWPKFFIEVSEKGNDSHPSFAKNNVLYKANRKISATLEPFMDIEGPITVTAFVTGTDIGLQTLGIKNKSDVKIEELLRNTVLLPFNKNRIRASQSKNSPSYEVNIWPVGLSEATGKLTVCNKESIGYHWPIPGVANTCPAAMAKDARAYWDTGMLDYLNPQTLISMQAIQANPLSCLGSQTITQYLQKSIGAIGKGANDTNSILKAISGLTSVYDGIRSCSWPILGNAEATFKSVSSVANVAKWSGPYCTLWGPIAPRMSTSIYNNDYSFANAALRFKLLAHELFAVPRPQEERWSLAYPWEPAFGDDNIAPQGSFINNLFDTEKFKKLYPTEFLSFDKTQSRSTSLLYVGDPRLIDTSLSPKYYTEKSINFGKELLYLATLSGASVASIKAAETQMNANLPASDKTNYTEEELSAIDQSKILERELKETEEKTAKLVKQKIYQPKYYCHQSQQGAPHLLTSGNVFEIGLIPNALPGVFRDIPFKGPVFEFREENNVHNCFNPKIFRGCLKSKGKIRGCKEYNDGLAIFYKRMVEVGEEYTQNPVIYEYKTFCDYSGDFYKKHHKKGVYYKCEDRIVNSVVMDTKERVDRPNSDDFYPDKTSDNLKKSIAGAFPWVAAEIVRAQYSNLTGHNILPGNKRVYTVWEKVTCDLDFILVEEKAGTSAFNVRIPEYFDIPEQNTKNPSYETLGRPSCRTAIRHYLRERFQLAYLRPFCDLIGQNLGKPFQ